MTDNDEWQRRAQAAEDKVARLIRDGISDEVWDRILARFLRRRGRFRVVAEPQETEES